MKHLLLIHGAWGGAWVYEETLSRLRELGHKATAIDLPGHGQNKASIPEVTMEAYVQTVVDAVEAIEGQVVLAGHSLAGAVVSQVAERIPHKIERLIYVAAILPKNGDSALGIMQSDAGGELLAQLEFSEDQTYVNVPKDVVKSVLLHDVKEPERLATFLPHFGMRQATEPFTSKASLTDADFGSVPKTYIRASIDKVLSPALQNEMIKNWSVDQVLTLESGHFPLLSVPKKLVTALHSAAMATTTHA
jgi:pimeloyl-ACP methyl ester carboxylesterase